LLREATNKGVINVARYYYHETVRVGGKDDDIRSNIREGLDITKAANYRQESSMLPPSTSAVAPRGRAAAVATLARSGHAAALMRHYRPVLRSSENLEFDRGMPARLFVLQLFASASSVDCVFFHTSSCSLP
jgi:hypothetical protein